MKRFLALSLVALGYFAVPCQAQILQKLEQSLLGGQGQQGMMPGQQMQQPTIIGNVNLPPGQYMMSNTQTGQAFYVVIQNGQMYLTGQPAPQQMMAPGQGGMMPQQQQQGGVGGMLKNGLGNFLNNTLSPQQPPVQQYGGQ